AFAGAGPDPEAIILEQRVSRFPVGSVGGVIDAGVLLAALVPVVTGQVHDGSDPEWSAEADRVAGARQCVVAGSVHQQPRAAYRRSLGTLRPDIAIIACQVNQQTQPGKACASRSLGQLIQIVPSAINQQPNAQPTGRQAQGCGVIGILAAQADQDANAVIRICVGRDPAAIGVVTPQIDDDGSPLIQVVGVRARPAARAGAGLGSTCPDAPPG